jgi:serine/threonine-protein kinase RsbW
MGRQTPGHTTRGRLELSSRREEIDRAQSSVLAAMATHGYDEGSRFAVRAAIEEALANAMDHGNAGDPRMPVLLEYEVRDDAVVVAVADGGLGFDPEAVPDPTRPENLDIPSGRGIALIRAFMTEVEISPPGNRLRMIYRIGCA